MTLTTRPLLLPAVLAAVALCAPTFLAQGAPPSFNARVTALNDADTITVSMKLRIHYIDAPETRQQGGAEATKYARDILLGRQITFTPISQSYDRTVADVYLGKQSVGLLLVESGHAMLDPRYNPPAELLKAQEDAKAENLGLWANRANVEPIAPWEWRKRRKK